MRITLNFAFEKETKGAVRFQEVGPDGKPAFAPQIGTLYVRKSAMSDGRVPQSLALTLSDEPEVTSKVRKAA